MPPMNWTVVWLTVRFMWPERYTHYIHTAHNTFTFVEQKEQATVPSNTNTSIWHVCAPSFSLVAMNGIDPGRNVMFIYSCGCSSTWYKDYWTARYNEWTYMRPRALLTSSWLQLSNTPLSAIKTSIRTTNIAMAYLHICIVQKQEDRGYVILQI